MTTETHIAGELYGLSAHPGDIYHRAAMTVEMLVRERDDADERGFYVSAKLEYAEARIAKLEKALSAAHYYIDASDRELSDAGMTREDALRAARITREAMGAVVVPVEATTGMVYALHEHERKVDMAHKAEVERLTRERDEARNNLIAEWCKGCGTISSDGHCHCNEWPDSPAECRDPMPFIRTWADYLRTDLVAAEARIAELTRERDEARSRFNDIDLCRMAQAPCNALLDAETRIAELTRERDEARALSEDRADYYHAANEMRAERDAEKADAAKWFAEYMALSHKQKGPVPDAALQARIVKLTALLDQQMGTPCEQIRHRQEIAAVRAAALEEAANVADGVGDKSRREIRSSLDASVIAAAIRALKEPS
jgi:hypothetical protein